MQTTSYNNRNTLKIMFAMNNCVLPGLDSFSGEVYGLSNDMNREAHLGSTRHDNVTILVNQIIKELEDDVAVQHPDLTRHESDQIRLQKNQMLPSSSMGPSSICPSLSGALIGVFVTCAATNHSHVDLSAFNPTSFWIHYDPNYQRPQISVHVAHTTTYAPWT